MPKSLISYFETNGLKGFYQILVFHRVLVADRASLVHVHFSYNTDKNSLGLWWNITKYILFGSGLTFEILVECE